MASARITAQTTGETLENSPSRKEMCEVGCRTDERTISNPHLLTKRAPIKGSLEVPSQVDRSRFNSSLPRDACAVINLLDASSPEDLMVERAWLPCGTTLACMSASRPRLREHRGTWLTSCGPKLFEQGCDEWRIFLIDFCLINGRGWHAPCCVCCVVSQVREGRCPASHFLFFALLVEGLEQPAPPFSMTSGRGNGNSGCPSRLPRGNGIVDNGMEWTGRDSCDSCSEWRFLRTGT